MATLFTYQSEVQRLLREGKQDLINPSDIVTHVNRARREIAMRAQCVRVLTPISGACVSASVINAGSGYISGSVAVAITAPDFPSGLPPFPGGSQATATPFVQNGSLSVVDISYGGSGYFQPTASVTGTGGGTGASVTLQVSPLNVLNANQEVYPFSGVDLSGTPGARAVYTVFGITVIYSNYRYALSIYPFSTYNSQVRQYTSQYLYVPTFASQYGQGAAGSFYVYPIPSQTLQYELDCLVIPSDLTVNLDVEILPEPWNDAVPYLAAAYGMMGIQNYNAAQFYKNWFDEFVQRYSNYARPGRGFNRYGRY